MGELDFDKSSQARYWMFDEESLQKCREEAVRGAPKVRKFAAGYANRKPGKESEGSATTTPPPISQFEHERLVAFHAKELQTLVGPSAMFPALRMGSSTLSSAIMIFKRFYLSNSVIDFHPRDIACAAASLASKLESNRLPVSPIVLPSAVLAATLVFSIESNESNLSWDWRRAGFSKGR